MNIRPLSETPRLRRDLARRDWLQFTACPGRQGRFVPELELCARAVAKFDPNLKRMGESSWGTGRKLRELGVFAGIGGFSLGLSMTGHFEPAGFIEIDPFCQKVLAKNFKGVPIYGDITTVTTDELIKLGRIDIITGGFPCQPFSDAGKKRGTADERFLWPQLFRVIAALRPPYLILENTKGLLTTQHGLVFAGILYDLCAAGYDVEWHTIAASSFGAPHQRDRLWIVAHTNGQRYQQSRSGKSAPHKTGLQTTENADSQRWQRVLRSELFKIGKPHFGWITPSPLDATSDLLQKLEQRLGEPSIFGDDDGLSSRMDRIAQLQSLGNAVVPQIVAAIGECVWSHHVAHLEHQPAPSGGERVSGVESGQGICEVRENVG